MARDKDFYTEVREDVKVIWDALHRLKGAKQAEWNAGLGATLPDGNDLQGAGDVHSGITADDIGEGVFAFTDALMTALTPVAASAQKLL